MRLAIPVVLVLAAAALMILAGCPARPATAPPTGAPPTPVAAGKAPAPAAAAPAANATTTDATAAADPKTLFETKCKLCHSLEKVAAEKLDQAGWAETVKDMAAKKAGWISDAEAAAITQYLAAAYPK